MEERYDVPVVLLFGGVGEERHISELGACGFIEKAKACGAMPLPLGITDGGDWYIYVGDSAKISSGEWSSDKDNLTRAYPQRKDAEGGFLPDFGFIRGGCVFPLLHGVGGEDGSVQGALMTAGINFVGCSHSTGALAYDKAYTKIIAESVGVPTVPWVLFISDGNRTDSDGTDRTAYTQSLALELAEGSFGFPMFIKPARSGSSFGASCAKTKAEFYESLERALKVDGRVLIEKAISDKTELECAYFSSSNREVISSPASIYVGRGFYDFDTKYKRGPESAALGAIDAQTEARVRAFTAKIAGVLGVRHISRFDYFLLEDGTLYFNEVNTFPGFTEKSLYLSMLEREGVDFRTFLSELSSSYRL